MSLREPILDINNDEPFKLCELGREKYGQVLTALVSNNAEGFVLAINNKWGTGKTTFVRMWQAQLEKELNTKSIYFNAWENDFEDNPLPAILGELKIWTNDPDGFSYKSLLKNAAVLSKELFPIWAKALIENYVGQGVITDSVKALTDGAVNILSDEVEDYVNRKESIIEFRSSLTKFINQQNREEDGKVVNAPLVFIVDELDRCRPNYAVLLLEQIKHFFSVDNIVFVLSIDKEQLGHAIRGVYGSENLDADEYLRRFIDIEYSLPDPDKEAFFNFLYAQLDFQSFFTIQNIRANEEDNFKGYTLLFIQNLELRKQRRILTHIRLVLRTYGQRELFVPQLFCFLIYVKFMHVDFYRILKKRDMKLEEMQSEFYKVVSPFNVEAHQRRLAIIEGNLLYYYNKNEYSSNSDQLFEYGGTSGDIILNIKTIFDDEGLKSVFQNVGGYGKGDLNLENFIDRIEITSGFKS